jgi:hypothetical protein
MARNVRPIGKPRHPTPPGTVRAGDSERADTPVSLTRGAAASSPPFVAKKLLDPLTPGVGRYATALMGAAATPP